MIVQSTWLRVDAAKTTALLLPDDISETPSVSSESAGNSRRLLRLGKVVEDPVISVVSSRADCFTVPEMYHCAAALSEVAATKPGMYPTCLY